MSDTRVRVILKALLVTAALCCLALWQAPGAWCKGTDKPDSDTTVTVASDDDLASEASLFEEMPVVLTASKRAEPINKAPSVAYVVTADDIKRWGARTLADVLKRVPGMRVSTRECSLIGSRGFTSDQNDKYVFLIDNVPITNIMQDGTYNYVDMPMLYMVDRIEVIKGPGSTLWGSDATFGIIHIFTKTGEGVQGVQATIDSEASSEFIAGNLLYGRSHGNMDSLVSLSYANSNGSIWGDGPGNSIFAWDGPNKESLIDSYHGGVPADDIPNVYAVDAAYASPNGNDTARESDLAPSLDLYGKVTVGGTTYKAHYFDVEEAYLWQNVYGAKVTDAYMRHLTLGVEHVQTISSVSTLTTRVDYHDMMYKRGIPISYSVPAALTKVDIMQESGFFAEAVYNTRLGDRHNLVAGAKITSVDFGPSTTDTFSIGENSTPHNNQVTTAPDTDTVYGVYVEDGYEMSKRLTVVGGLSYEYSALREKGGKTMPRVTAIYQINDAVTAKYAYNTGFQRPPAEKMLSNVYGFVTRSEDITESDAQIMYNKRGTNASLTAFDYKVEHYFGWADTRVFDPDTHEVISGGMGHHNLGTAKGRGLEFDLRHRFSDQWSANANWCYAKTSLDGAPFVGEPRQVFNIGVDWTHGDDLTVNLNLNGWRRMYHGDDPDGNKLYWSGAGEEVVDMAVVFGNVAKRPLTVTLYARNLLDEKVHVGMTGWPGYTYLPGRLLGVKVGCKF